MKCEGHILDELAQARDKLYESLPTGEIDAFDLIKAIKAHIEDLDTIHDYYSKVQSDMHKSQHTGDNK